MRILIAQARFALGGTETYAATVAEQFERLGHPTTVYAPSATDRGRDFAAARAIRLETGADPPGEEFDALLAQDTASAYLLAGRERPPRQVFVIHGMSPAERPALSIDPPPPVVALNERIAARAAAFAGSGEVVRLRQPIDVMRHRPRTPARRRARRLLVLSNGLADWRADALAEVCAELGIEFARVGGPGRDSVQPEEEIAGADIVVGYGRSILEGMAMGKAAYVWERAGGDGWVTPETYEALEADGFSGAASDGVIDRERLREDLAAYRPELGDLAFDLVRQHHSATKHAEALLGLLAAGEPPRAPEGFETIALLARGEQRAVIRADGAEYANGRIWDERGVALERAERAEAAVAAAEARAAAAESRAGAEEARRIEAESRLETILGSRSWRLTGFLRRVGARLRGR